RFQLWAESERYEAVRGTVSASFGDNVVFEETVPGKYWRVEASSDLRFNQQLDATLSLNGERDRRRANDSRFADVLIPRLRVAYQFTPELALRTIGEFRVQRGYDTQSALSSRERSLSLDFL